MKSRRELGDLGLGWLFVKDAMEAEVVAIERVCQLGLETMGQIGKRGLNCGPLIDK